MRFTFVDYDVLKYGYKLLCPLLYIYFSTFIIGKKMLMCDCRNVQFVEINCPIFYWENMFMTIIIIWKYLKTIVEHYKQCPYEKNLQRVLDENSFDILIKQTPQKIIPSQFHMLHNQNIGQ